MSGRTRRLCAGALALICLSLLALVVGPSPGTAQTDPSAATAPTPTPSGREELPAERTRTSSTYLNPDGTQVARVSEGSLHFRDRAGEWTAIDNTLVPDADGNLENRANAYRLELPRALDRDPVRIERDGRWLSFALAGAAAVAPTATDARARYADALPGVDLRYVAGPDAVKEELILASKDAPSLYTYALDLSPGLEARETDGGGIDVRDGEDRLQFALLPPFMSDAAGERGEVAMKLSADGGQITLRADRAWLDAPGRAYPVALDPTVATSALRDCTIRSATPSTPECLGDLGVGATAAQGESRALLSFELQSKIPRGARVLGAKVGAYLKAGSTSADIPLGLHELTRSFTDAASWTKRDATQAWAEPGSDHAAEALATQSVGSALGWRYWTPTLAPIQTWVDEPSQNLGVLLKGPGPGAANSLAFASDEEATRQPYIEVTYDKGLGLRPEWTYESRALTGSLDLHANVGYGNVVLAARDLVLPGTGLSFDVTRYFNNLSNTDRQFGPGWSIGHGRDMRLSVTPDGSRIYESPSGAAYLFRRAADGSYAAPPELDATLLDQPDGTSTLTLRDTGEVLRFKAQNAPYLFERSDGQGHSITSQYTSGSLLDSVTDTQGRITRFARDAAARINTLTDPGSGVFSYGRDASGRITSATDPAGARVEYAYDSAGNLIGVTDPAGQLTKLTYDGSRRVKTITRVTDAAAGSGPTTGYAYETADPRCPAGTKSTDSTDPAGIKTTYCWDVRRRVVESFPASAAAKPRIALSGALKSQEGGWLSGASYALQVDATDGSPLQPGSGVKSIEILVDGVRRDWVEQPCLAGSCPLTRAWTLAAGDYSEGVHSVRVIATDQAGHTSEETLSVKLDSSPPVLSTSGSLKDAASAGTPLTGDAYELRVRAEDGSTEAPRSGVGSIEVFVDGTRADFKEQTCAAGSCALERSWTLQTDEYAVGEHTIRVVSKDQLGQESVESFVVRIAGNLFESQYSAGLEDFFHYDSTETGAGTRAHVNLYTGNLVWHSTPLINPGRGLSSVVNLTYNSQQPLEGEVTAPYAQAGRGFSLGISGLTRLNEPLDLKAAALGLVVLTDPDGTRHRFKAPVGGTSYSAPPGVNIALRQTTDALGPHAWAATRPDGVTHYFDALGYQTEIVDRNSNKVTFEYDHLVDQVLQASPCDPLTVSGCAKRVREVKDPAGSDGAPSRSILVGYHGAATDVPQTTQGKVASLTDHAGRITRFAYTHGQLTRLTQAAGTGVERSFGFAYETATAEAADPDLIGVTDPRGAETRFEHARDSLDASGLCTSPLRKRAVSVRKRTGGLRTMSYSCSDAEQRATARVTDARSHNFRYTLDRAGRLRESEDARGTLTRLDWDPDNNVRTLVEAAGSSDEATTSMTYNSNGMLLEQTDPLGRTTRLAYQDSEAGDSALLGGLLAPPATGFVSDLVSMTTPKGTATATQGDFESRFELDGRGNVVARRERGKPGTQDIHVARTAYDAHGQITREEEWVLEGDANARPNTTTYADFDANGMPRETIDPKGNASQDKPADGRWERSYDAVGNVLSVTDPRKEANHGAEAFKTSLTYDALDRLSSEKLPKESLSGVFITRSYEHDPNGNEVARIDGENKRWTQEFDAMDDLRLSSSPTAPQFGSSTPRPEETEYAYDSEGNMTVQTRALGMNNGVDHDYSTRFVYDGVGQPVAQTRRSRAGTQATDLATSWAYDRRGNVTGMVDPKRNQAFSDRSPAENAKSEARRRFTYAWDRADNRTSQVEDPGGKALKTQWRYDANDNKVAEIDPRGAEPNADPNVFTRRWEYDERDRMSAEIDPKGGRTRYVLNPEGTLAARTTPKGMASPTSGDYEIRMSYDPAGQLSSRSLPWAPGQYGLLKDASGNPIAKKVAYSRDAVGNPTRITDARGNSFANSFLDSGELRSTERPSWWAIDGGRAEEQGPGNQAISDELPASGGQGDFGAVEPEPMPDLMPRKGRTELAYDDELRLKSVTETVAGVSSSLSYDAIGRLTELRRPLDVTSKPIAEVGSADWIVEAYAYDSHGNERQALDAEGKATQTDFDQFDRPVRAAAPGSATAEEVSKTAYDSNDNAVRIETPRGPDFASQMTYDALDRLEAEVNPAGERTSFGYDAAGNQISERFPRGHGAEVTQIADPALRDLEADRFTEWSEYDALNRLTRVRERAASDNTRAESTYSYDPNSNMLRSVEPGARKQAGAPIEPRITAYTHDGRDLPWTETRGEDAEQRTTVSEWDPNGNLRRTVNPAGVEESTGSALEADPGTAVTPESAWTKHATVMEYSSEDLLERRHLPWGARDADDAKRYLQLFTHDARGRVASVSSPHEANAPALSTTYAHYDTGWIKSSNEPAFNDPDSGESYDLASHYAYDRRGAQTTWITKKSSSNAVQRRVSREYFPNGLLKKRTAEKLAAPAEPARSYEYSYNSNGSMTGMQDVEKARTTLYVRDSAERELRVNETWAEGKDTVSAYDADGNTTSRGSDGRFEVDSGTYAGGKRSSFAFDRLGRELSTQVKPDNEPERSTTSAWFPSGELASRTHSNGVKEEKLYASDGRLTWMGRSKDAGAPLKDQPYAYDRNGNRSRDERGAHGFNARAQLVAWERGAQDPQAGKRVTYKLNGSGAMVQETDEAEPAGEQVTDFSYRAGSDRLESFSRAGHTTRLSYDDAGAVKKLEQLSPTGVSEAKDELRYDGFERLVGSKGSLETGETLNTYDGLDRRESSTAPGQAKRSLSYVGSSEALSEQEGGGTKHSYDYDSQGERLGQSTQGGAAGADGFRTYSRDANGSVEALEGTEGQAPGLKDRYAYSPYGKSGEDADAGLSEAAKANPFRFEGFSYDSGIKSYDMQARAYSPRIGRFLSQDRYESASGDLALQSDPLTQERYAFAGGNPVNRVEWDGHYTCRSASGGPGACPKGQKNPDAASDARSRRQRQAQGPKRIKPAPAPQRPAPQPQRAAPAQQPRPAPRQQGPVQQQARPAPRPQPRPTHQAKPKPRSVVSKAVGTKKENVATAKGFTCGASLETVCPGNAAEKRSDAYNDGRIASNFAGGGVGAVGKGAARAGKEVADEALERVTVRDGKIVQPPRPPYTASKGVPAEQRRKDQAIGDRMRENQGSRSMRGKRGVADTMRDLLGAINKTDDS